MSSLDTATAIASRLVGRHVTTVIRRDYDWAFQFAENIGLRVECPWRIVIGGRIALASTDDGQKFGFPEPLNAEAKSADLLKSKAVEAIAVRDDTGDLTIRFGDGTALEVLNMSSGYEGWELNAAGLHIIATGGGELAIYEKQNS